MAAHFIPAQKRDHEMLHLREDGRPLDLRRIQDGVAAPNEPAEFPPFRTERLGFHGARKNAVNALLEVGCSEAASCSDRQYESGDGAPYSSKVSQLRLARAAIEQFEARWEKLRPSVLGNLKIVE
jgi:hypothetical protein